MKTVIVVYTLLPWFLLVMASLLNFSLPVDFRYQSINTTVSTVALIWTVISPAVLLGAIFVSYTEGQRNQKANK